MGHTVSGGFHSPVHPSVFLLEAGQMPFAWWVGFVLKRLTDGSQLFLELGMDSVVKKMLQFYKVVVCCKKKCQMLNDEMD